MEGLISQREREVTDPRLRVGATYVQGDGVYIRLWAPRIREAKIEWIGGETLPLTQEEHGYFTGHFPDRKPGDRYFFHIEGKRIPDPASRFQPEDVYGPSEVVAQDYAWTDQAWQGVPFEKWVIYEIHPGTYSDRHDFQGIIDDLPRLKDLGVTTLEIMPVSQFSGARNWGYDGVFPHAVQNSYGGPDKLKALVDACHAHGLAIILDVVYNHIGPEGNVLYGCAPYVRERYHTPWGDALNFDGEGSHHVRQYFLQTVWQWLTEYHFDGLRLDAVPSIFDNAPITFLEEITRLRNRAAEQRGLRLPLTVESDMNDPRYIIPLEQNGIGMDAHWADDLHHALHTLLTGETAGYYADYDPALPESGIAMLARIYREGVAFGGRYSPFRDRIHGRSYAGIDKTRLIVQTQNHDQIGNRLMGERLITLVGPEKAKLAAAAILLSPFTPLLFQGEEYGCDQPFTYFISHHDKALVEAVRKGRSEEWHRFNWSSEPPDPAADATFENCVLHDKSGDSGMLDWYKALIGWSKKLRTRALWSERIAGTDCLSLRYTGEGEDILVLLHFGDKPAPVALPKGEWQVELQSHEGDINTMPPFAAAVLRIAGG